LFVVLPLVLYRRVESLWFSSAVAILLAIVFVGICTVMVVSPILNDVVRLSYALHLMLVFPLLNFSLRANIDELIFPKKEHLATDTKRFMYLTLILLALSYLVAIATVVIA
ncbi:hypothetical protein A4A49_51799, partial [Nicotiana attenuata]